MSRRCAIEALCNPALYDIDEDSFVLEELTINDLAVPTDDCSTASDEATDSVTADDTTNLSESSDTEEEEDTGPSDDEGSSSGEDLTSSDSSGKLRRLTNGLIITLRR